jgi:RNA polymerase sigma factor (sigma-70 family)
VTSATQQAIDAVWRIESARLIAGLARVIGDIGLAEDLAQDALVAALEQWPESGVPDNPGAWLMAVARRRGVDTIRRDVTLQRKVELLGRELRDRETPMDEIEVEAHVDDDVLRLMFTACHPVLSVDARVALTLKMVAGLSTEEIARAFVVQTTTMAARITRAKKALTQANVPFEVPVGEDLAGRLGSVLEAVYLGRVSQFTQPGDDRTEHDAASVSDRELVVAGGEPSPLLERIEGTLHDVSALVRLGVEPGRPATLGTLALAVPDLPGGLGDHRLDPSGAQHRPVSPRGVRLVRHHSIGSGPRPTRTDPWDANRIEQVRKHRRVVRMARTQQQHQRAPFAVTRVVNLRAQSATGTADRVISRLDQQILVIRQIPPCRGAGSYRAGGPG